MARSLQVPAVVGLKDASHKIKSGAHVLLDGYNGSVIVNPTDQTLFRIRPVGPAPGFDRGEIARHPDRCPPSRWTGKRSPFRPTSNRPATCEAVRNFGAEGVGLFRTEYLFHQSRHRCRREEEQYQAYRQRGRRVEAGPGHHSHLGFGRGQIFVAPANSAGDEPVFGLAGHSVLPGGTRGFPRAIARHPAGQRGGQRQDHVPDDFLLRRSGKGQRAGRGIQKRIARGEDSLR